MDRKFVSFSHVFEGHHRNCVTPYMHVFAYHVPDQIREYGNVRQFSGQGVEKNNDDTKRHYYSGNRHKCNIYRIDHEQRSMNVIQPRNEPK